MSREKVVTGKEYSWMPSEVVWIAKSSRISDKWGILFVLRNGSEQFVTHESEASRDMQYNIAVNIWNEYYE